jgi:hypothetical protein
MKFTITLFILLLQSIIFAQKQNPCDYSSNITDSIGTYKETKSCLVYEKIFGNTSQFIFLSLISENGTPYLSIEIIQKSTDFISPKCFDKDSKVYFQLSNGKIYTLLNANEIDCAKLMYDNEEKLNNRFLKGNFLFRKDDYEDIKKLPIAMMRIKFASETIDYVLPKELKSEKIIGTYEQENFFIKNFSCVN